MAHRDWLLICTLKILLLTYLLTTQRMKQQLTSSRVLGNVPHETITIKDRSVIVDVLRTYTDLGITGQRWLECIGLVVCENVEVPDRTTAWLITVEGPRQTDLSRVLVDDECAVVRELTRQTVADVRFTIHVGVSRSNLHCIKRLRSAITLLENTSSNTAMKKHLLSTTNTSRRYLRSATHGDLLVPRKRTVTYGLRSFAVSCPAVWNTLPSTLRVSTTTLGHFQSGVKTILIRLAYGTWLGAFVTV